MIRPLESTEQKLLREKKRRRWISIIMLGILVLSSVGYAFLSYQGNSSEQTTNPTRGIGADGRYYFLFGEQQLSLLHAPDAVSSTAVNTSRTLQDYASKTVYIVNDNPSISYELESTLGIYYRLQPACHGACEKDLPEKNCSDALIIWKDSLENRVYEQEQCVFIEGDLRAVDAFLYRIFGVQ